MKLQKYIDQLIVDIETATNTIPETWSPWEEQADEEFGLLPWMEDIDSAPTKSLEEWCQIKKEQLPPEEALTDAQVLRLLDSIKTLLDAYNCSAVFQIRVPERIQYRVIRARFDQQVPMLKANYFFFAFCDDDTNRKDCLLGEKYCHCRFFEAFFKKFSNSTQEETSSDEYAIDPYEEYMLKKRYGDRWYQYIRSDDEEEWEEGDDDLGYEEDDDLEDLPF